MAKFNRPNTVSQHPNATVNEEGGLAFSMDKKMELYTRAASCLVGEPKFYDPEAKGDDNIKALVKAVADEDPEFILQLASHARNDLYLRSLPVMLLVEATAHAKAKAYVRAYTPDIVQRADELSEVLAAYIQKNGQVGSAGQGHLSNPLRRGLAACWAKFDEYQLAKYDREGAVKLKDALRLTHPKPKTDEQRALWGRLLKDELKTPDTWEVIISTKGSTKENWELAAQKMGYMAKLRNLRNFLDKGVSDETLQGVLAHLTNANAVKNSKQFPFRFYSAYRELGGTMGTIRGRAQSNPVNTQRALDALQTAMELAVENLPELPGVTAVFQDNSGSMEARVSEKSSVSRREVGAALAAMVVKQGRSVVAGAFGESYMTVPLSKHDGILTNLQKLESAQVGHSTEAWKAFAYLVQNKIKVDRIFLFSDMQCYNAQSMTGYWPYGVRTEQSVAQLIRNYRSAINPNVYLYSFDLAGYGTSQVPQDDPKTCLLAGWSDRVLSYVDAYENGFGGAIEKVKSIKPGRKQNGENRDHVAE